MDGVVEFYENNQANGFMEVGTSVRVLNFTNKELDRDLELSYFGARYYQPEFPRFLSTDPAAGNINRIKSWNRYIFTVNDPLNNVDLDRWAPSPLDPTGNSDMPLPEPFRAQAPTIKYTKPNIPPRERAKKELIRQFKESEANDFCRACWYAWSPTNWKRGREAAAEKAVYGKGNHSQVRNPKGLCGDQAWYLAMILQENEYWRIKRIHGRKGSGEQLKTHGAVLLTPMENAPYDINGAFVIDPWKNTIYSVRAFITKYEIIEIQI